MDNRYVQVTLRAAMSIALFGLLVALAAKVSVFLAVVVAVLGVVFVVAGVMMDRTNTMLERGDFKELSRLAQALPADEVVPASGVWLRVERHGKDMVVVRVSEADIEDARRDLAEGQQQSTVSCEEFTLKWPGFVTRGHRYMSAVLEDGQVRVLPAPRSSLPDRVRSWWLVGRLGTALTSLAELEQLAEQLRQAASQA
ncbi:hypothetical protein [Nonomuraea sp. NPDC049480]|uniref:hypothetical protein n=1 Tax=Nonomuraea sp. NPDC049480 TaxID=3364353 RepID=UPI003796B520